MREVLQGDGEGLPVHVPQSLHEDLVLGRNAGAGGKGLGLVGAIGQVVDVEQQVEQHREFVVRGDGLRRRDLLVQVAESLFVLRRVELCGCFAELDATVQCRAVVEARGW